MSGEVDHLSEASVGEDCFTHLAGVVGDWLAFAVEALQPGVVVCVEVTHQQDQRYSFERQKVDDVLVDCMEYRAVCRGGSVEAAHVHWTAFMSEANPHEFVLALGCHRLHVHGVEGGFGVDKDPTTADVTVTAVRLVVAVEDDGAAWACHGVHLELGDDDDVRCGVGLRDADVEFVELVAETVHVQGPGGEVVVFGIFCFLF